MLPFTPGTDLIEARDRQRVAVDDVLNALSIGHLPSAVEREAVDIKEEAGRRGAGGQLLAGTAQNTSAADKLAPEVACMANSPGGGAIIVGVDDKTGDLLGTALDSEWLRHRIYERIDLAPLAEERIVNGIRLLVLYVAESREPVEDQNGEIRWRTADNCVRVDRAEWWLYRQSTTGADMMAGATTRNIDDLSPGAVAMARSLATSSGVAIPDSSSSAADFLSWLGVLRPDGFLTQAGALAFCPSERAWITLSVVDVEGGDVLAAPTLHAGNSLIEQVAEVETRLDTLNNAVTVFSGFHESAVRRLPPRAVREAVLNGVIHRDWLQTDPVDVRWIQEDSTLVVTSPGGFGGGVSADNALTQRYARYPALADLFRALGLVDKQGMGVDRMMREMVALGHRPPSLSEIPGPSVRVRLAGGEPTVPVMTLVGRIRPTVRQKDVRIALIVHTLLHQPFVTPETLTTILQREAGECAEALAAAAECRVDHEPLIALHKDVWVFSPEALALIEDSGDDGLSGLHRHGLLLYRRPDSPLRVVLPWLEARPRITSGDYSALSGYTQTAALKHLDRLVEDGILTRGDGRGRNAHFTRAAGSREFS